MSLIVRPCNEGPFKKADCKNFKLKLNHINGKSEITNRSNFPLNHLCNTMNKEEIRYTSIITIASLILGLLCTSFMDGSWGSMGALEYLIWGLPLLSAASIILGFAIRTSKQAIANYSIIFSSIIIPFFIVCAILLLQRIFLA